ncbi:MAG: hypothetical protein E7466_00230 [Ruminococcaceae bacterium]|nr:hypothetical protein [Oscillospiraceae bacterium]
MTNTADVKIVDAQFKDSSPLATVEKIKGILKDNGIETVEIWHDTSVPYCYAMSVKVPGTIFSVNGKGLTKEFTLASGYGELMERLQMGFINGPNVQKDGDFAFDSTKYELRSASDLLERNRNWYELLAASLKRLTGVVMTPEEIISQYAGKDGLLSATPYQNITTGTKEYLPTDMRKRVYATNGCAAGNSPEEAIVQALSEIVERHHQTRIIDECLALPEIPEDVLAKYEVASKIVRFVRENGYKVILKDASLGTGFPVVCACIIDCQTGRYHTHFGAYPIFEIALERSLTESFQGRNIRNITTLEDFLVRKPGEYSLASISNEMTMGTWIKTPEFFVGNSAIPFDENVGMTGGNNKQLLQQCKDYFSRLGYDILVRDRSCLGFPTYQVIVPGYSEMLIHRLSQKMDDHRYAPYAMRSLRDPATASMPDMLGLIMHLDQMDKFTSNIRGVHGFLRGAKLSADLTPSEEQHFMSAAMGYVYWTLGRRNDVIPCLDGLMPKATEAELEYLICLKRYLSLAKTGHSADSIRQVIDLFHKPDTVQKLYNCLASKTNPLADFILRCDLKCDGSCKMFNKCFEKRARELTAMLDEKSKKLDLSSLEGI